MSLAFRFCGDNENIMNLLMNLVNESYSEGGLKDNR